MGLKEYKARRNFRQTREPAGKIGERRSRDPFFVVQKHDATRLHYDFRLEMEGVLKSWAVPKGFPLKRGDRRLAVQVEDHPINYARFEGTIPEGNYGAGTVMVWDIGTYQVESGDPRRALESGKLHLTLKGKKLKGEWTLVRMRARGNETKPQWLVIKSGDDLPPFSSRAEDQSVLTGRSLKKIATDNDAQWQSNQSVERSKRVVRRSLPDAAPRSEMAGRKKRAGGQEEVPGLEPDLKRLPKQRSGFVEPMKAVLTDHLPKGPEWVYEVKFDGVRALAIKRKNDLQLISRNAKDMTARFPGVVEALRRLPAGEAVFDGEVVALDPQGRSSFQMLQAHQQPGSTPPPIYYYVFDLIQLEGRDVTGLPLLERKAAARELVARVPDDVRFSASLSADSGRLIREMKARGLEGLMAKRKDSKYEIGRRSGAWMKFKWTNEQEFVIGGFSRPRGTRKYFGAILVGYYAGKKLMFASKVGSGFDQNSLKLLHGKFQNLTQPDSAFANLPEKAGFHGRGLTTAEMRRCTWLKPELVCEVRFNEWTRDHHLRQPTFLGLREDKEPREVIREKAR